MFKRCIVAALALPDVAMAADGLAPGKPASVKTAQMMDTPTLLGLGLAAVAIGVVIGVSSGPGKTSVSTSTTS